MLDGAEESLAGFGGPFAGEQGEHPQNPQSPHTPMPGGYSDQLQTPYKPRIRRSPGSSQSSSRYGSPGPGTPDETPSRPPRQGSIGGMANVPYTNQPLAMGPSQSASWLQAPRLQSLVQSERDLQHLQASQSQGQGISRTPTPNLDFDLRGLQAEIDRAHESAASAAKETLRQIFPSMDEEILVWVLEANEGDLGKSIEALLEMSSGT